MFSFILFLFLLLVVSVLAFAGRRQLATYTQSYVCTNSPQTWILPDKSFLSSIIIEAYGAAGGQSNGGGSGGMGAYVEVVIPANSSLLSAIASGSIFYVYVGCQGSSTNAAGGYNGGGAQDNGGSGGGATDLRLLSTDLSTRLVVAGGGGGAGLANNGGGGGGSTGTEGFATDGIGGGGGSQTSGGLGHTDIYGHTSTSGTSGQGGNGVWGSGGGGGGFFGGGGGVLNSGGGGGSSYFNLSIGNMTTNVQGVRSGDGALYITLACLAGYYLDGTTCKACEAGKYASSAGSPSCDPCPSGSVTNTLAKSGASSCTICPNGKYSNSSQVSCAACSPGSHSFASSTTNLLVNGGFENQQSIGASNWEYTTPLGWSVTSGANAIVAGYKNLGWLVATPLSASGVYFCGIQNDGSLSQIIKVPSSSSNKITIAFAASYRTSGPSKQGYLDVSLNGTSYFHQELTYVWQSFVLPSITIASAGGSYVLTLTHTNLGSCQTGDCTVYLDKVSVSIPGASNCSFCATGTYNPSPSSGQSSCQSCAAGTYNPVSGSTAQVDCKLCPANTYTSIAGQSVCTNCASSLNASAGATACSVFPLPPSQKKSDNSGGGTSSTTSSLLGLLVLIIIPIGVSLLLLQKGKCSITTQNSNNVEGEIEMENGGLGISKSSHAINGRGNYEDVTADSPLRHADQAEMEMAVHSFELTPPWPDTSVQMAHEAAPERSSIAFDGGASGKLPTVSMTIEIDHRDVSDELDSLRSAEQVGDSGALPIALTMTHSPLARFQHQPTTTFSIPH